MPEKPSITVKHVRDALESLLYATHSPVPNPLQHLMLVELWLSKQVVQPALHPRRFALNAMLVDEITSTYNHRRRQLNLPQPAANATRDEAQSTLLADSQQDAPELLGWSLLYHRYVCSDLELSYPLLTAATHRPYKTLSRYQQYALKQLTDQIAEREWVARQEHHKLHLFAKLPTSRRKTLFGRDAEIRQLQRMMQEYPDGLLIQVMGEHGVGKSALVEQVIITAIDRQRVDRLIWVHHAPSVAAVRQHIVDELLVDGTNLTLKDAALLHAVYIVIDNFDRLQNDDGFQTSFTSLLTELTSCMVFMIGQTVPVLEQTDSVVTLKPLDASSAREFAKSVVSEGLGDDGVDALVRLAAGNPLLLQLATKQMQHLTNVPNNSASQYYESLNSHLSEQARRVWQMLAVIPANTVSHAMFEEIWQEPIGAESLVALLQAGVINRVGEAHYTVVESAHEACLNALKSSPKNADFLRVLDHQDPHREVSSDVLSTVEFLLQNDTLLADARRQRDWTEKYWRAGIECSHYEIWEGILAKCRIDVEHDLDLALALAAVAIGRFRWDAASKLLDGLVARAGRASAFILQAEAELVAAKSYRMQGYFKRAYVLVEHARTIVSRMGHRRLMDVSLMEQLQLSLEVGDFETAEACLQQLPESTPILLARAKLLASREDTAGCESLLEHFLASRVVDDLNKARGYAIIADLPIRRGDTASALNLLETALTIFEQHGDIYTLARLHLNLGAIYLELEDFAHAEQLLRSAFATQTKIKDHAGLVRTQHNLNLLHTRRATGDM